MGSVNIEFNSFFRSFRLVSFGSNGARLESTETSGDPKPAEMLQDFERFKKEDFHLEMSNLEISKPSELTSSASLEDSDVSETLGSSRIPTSLENIAAIENAIEVENVDSSEATDVSKTVHSAEVLGNSEAVENTINNMHESLNTNTNISANANANTNGSGNGTSSENSAEFLMVDWMVQIQSMALIVIFNYVK